MQINPPTAFLVVGFLHVALPIVAWTILRNRHRRTAVALWCAGTVATGVCFILIALRSAIPDWASFVAANVIGFGAWFMLVAALRKELDDRIRTALSLALWLLASVIYELLYAMEALTSLRVLFSTGIHLAGTAWVCVLARRLYRQTGFRSAALLAGAYAIFGVALAMRLGAVAWNWRTAQAFAPGMDFALTFVSGLFAALYGNLGYIGIALETSQRHDMAKGAELAREQERLLQAEAHARGLSALLEQREQLLTERSELLTALAHEVRQPLNNASAALQGAEAVISRGTESQAAIAAGLRRASTVINHVSAAVDNTLADAVLLNGAEPLAVQDFDIDMLLHLVLADMPLDERGRVGIVREAATRTAAMHSGLMRLALRNLLANALKYAPAGSPVTLRISDSDDPLALLIDVSDRGPGVPDALLPNLFSRGARALEAQHRQGHGLGLYLVRRIMELHGGSASILHTGTQGSTFRLLIPQDAGA